MTERPVTVFFDASSFISVGSPPGNVAFQRIADLVRHGFISVVTTDPTMKEVITHHTRGTFKALQPLANPRFRRLSARHFSIDIPDLADANIRERTKRDITVGVEKMFQSLEARILDIDDVSPAIVFEAYHLNEGVFVAHNKKDQFPDAFIFECVKAVASSDSPLLIVAHDNDFEGPAKGEGNIQLVKSVSELFAKLGLKQDEPALDLEPFLCDELMQNSEFLSYVEIQDDYMDGNRVTANCRNVDLESINAFQQADESAPLLLSVDATVELDVEIESNYGHDYDLETGSASVSFYASIENNDQGVPSSISELRVFKCSMSWGDTSRWYNF